jgi:hypothetical protein
MRCPPATPHRITRSLAEFSANQRGVKYCPKNHVPIVETEYSKASFRIMEDKSRSELISDAERELAETKVLVDEQYATVRRLKRIGANTKQAICLLIDLLELQQMREQRLAYLRLRLENRRG